MLAPYPIGNTVTIRDAGEEYNGLTGTIQVIQPDGPENEEFGGEEATYYLETNGRKIEQALSYWQLVSER